MEEVSRKPMGFATMTKERLREVCRAAGRAARASGKSREFTKETARAIGALGGKATAAKPGHMAELGRRGGLVTAQKPGHMSRLGELSREARRARIAAESGTGSKTPAETE